MATVARIAGEHKGWRGDRRARIARLHLEGYTDREIAEAMDLRLATVAFFLKKLCADWRRSGDADYAARKAKELAKLDEVERKANREWRRSRRDGRVVKRTYEVVELASVVVDPSDPFADAAPRREKVLVSEVIEDRGQCGDPAYLRLVKECVVERLKLMGAYDDEQRAMLTPEQAVAMMNAAVRAAELELRLDADQVARLRQRTLRLLSKPVGDTGGMRETPSPVVVEDMAPHANDVSAVTDTETAEPPDRPEDFGEI